MKLTTTLMLWLIISLLTTQAFANEIEDRFIKAGLVNVASMDATIQVDLVNASADKNFFKTNFYGDLKYAYLRPAIAHKLAKAQMILKRSHADYSLQILDAARPRSVSRAMYEQMKGTRFERFVANPSKGSMHNYGIAVDITIVDGNGKELDMGISPFKRSTTRIYWDYLLKKLGNEPSAKQLSNRKLLADTMIKAGFFPLSFEWWHFNGMDKKQVRSTYQIIE